MLPAFLQRVNASLASLDQKAMAEVLDFPLDYSHMEHGKWITEEFPTAEDLWLACNGVPPERRPYERCPLPIEGPDPKIYGRPIARTDILFRFDPSPGSETAQFWEAIWWGDQWMINQLWRWEPEKKKKK